MLIHQRDQQCVQADLVSRRCAALRQCFDECVLGQFAVFVEVVGGSESLHFADNAVAVAEAARRFPYAAAEVLTADLAVLADAQRRSTGHRRPSICQSRVESNHAGAAAASGLSDGTRTPVCGKTSGCIETPKYTSEQRRSRSGPTTTSVQMHRHATLVLHGSLHELPGIGRAIIHGRCKRSLRDRQRLRL